MKVALIFLAILAVALANPLPQVSVPVRFHNVVDDAGQYALLYHTSDLAHVEQGSLRRIDGATVLVKKGSYEYIDANGKRYRTSYIADENGFRPVGDHIPV